MNMCISAVRVAFYHQSQALIALRLRNLKDFVTISVPYLKHYYLHCCLTFTQSEVYTLYLAQFSSNKIQIQSGTTDFLKTFSPINVCLCSGNASHYLYLVSHLALKMSLIHFQFVLNKKKITDNTKPLT